VKGQVIGAAASQGDRQEDEQNATARSAPAAPARPSEARDRTGIAREHFVEWNGRPVLSVKKAFRTVVKLARIDTTIENVTPHTRRHTAATWLMQNGTDLWSAAG
jgi:integrase